MIWIFLSLSLVWLAIGAVGLASLAKLRKLPALAATPPQGRVSVIIPARDEAERIETTVSRLLAQQSVDLEIILIDDRSTDSTPEILRRLSREHNELRVITIEELPEGWLGKCHACHLGAQASQGDWILFADADSWMSPDLIARALQTAEREGVEHVSLAPALAGTAGLGRAVALAMCIGLLKEAASVNRGRKGAYIGLGAFNMVNKRAYEAIGGHEALRMEVVDDIRLGFLLEQHGFKTRVLFALNDLEVAWIQSLPSFYKVIEKNYFAVLGFSTMRLTLIASTAIAVWCGSVIAPFIDSNWGWLPLACMFAPALPAAILAPQYGWSRSNALFIPLAFAIVITGMLYSGITTLRRGGVRWRDSFYKLADLRAGQVR